MSEGPCIDNRSKWQRFNFEDWIYSLLSEKWCGNDMVPLDHRTLHVKERETLEYVFSFLNDSFEVGIGYPSEWHVILKRKTFHKMLFWYLRRWIFSEWLGLRRYIWYKLLFRRCEKTRRFNTGYSPVGEK